jgi:glycosyltransferase involved in cell wall biosynthesis
MEIWCKTMPEHGHSPAVAAQLEELGCRVILLQDEHGRMNWPVLFKAIASTWRRRPDVFFTLAMRHLSVVLATLVAAKNSVYYHITHDLNAATVKRLGLYARFFKRMVFICPATYDEFPGAAQSTQFTWVPQSSEIPVREPQKLAGEREQLLEPETPVRFGLLGRLTNDKGSAVMVEFVKTAAVACELHVAGSGPFAETFRELESGAKGRVAVRFHGAYDPSEREAFLRRFLTGVDYVLVPSQDQWETLSMATLEALQHGVPAVLCRMGGLISFAHPELGPAAGEVVRLVEPAAFSQTLTDLASQSRRSQKEAVAQCRTYYEKYFRDEVVLQQWLSVVGS